VHERAPLRKAARGGFRGLPRHREVVPGQLRQGVAQAARQRPPRRRPDLRGLGRRRGQALRHDRLVGPAGRVLVDERHARRRDQARPPLRVRRGRGRDDSPPRVQRVRPDLGGDGRRNPLARLPRDVRGAAQRLDRARRGRRKNVAMATPRADPAASDPEVDGFLALLAARRAPKTVDAYRRDLRALGDWLGGPPSKATTDDLERWLAELRAAGLSPATIARRVAAVRSFFRHLILLGARTDSPAAALELPRRRRRLPRTLSAAEAQRLIEAAPGTTPRSMRDRALVELLYGA